MLPPFQKEAPEPRVAHWQKLELWVQGTKLGQAQAVSHKGATCVHVHPCPGSALLQLCSPAHFPPVHQPYLVDWVHWRVRNGYRALHHSQGERLLHLPHYSDTFKSAKIHKWVHKWEQYYHQTNLTVASKWTFYIVLDVNYFVFISHFSQHVKAKVSSIFFFLQERKRLKIIVKMHIYMHIFADISEVSKVLQTGLIPAISFSRRNFEISFIVQNFKTKALPTVPEKSLSQVWVSTPSSEAAAGEACEPSRPLTAQQITPYNPFQYT